MSRRAAFNNTMNVFKGPDFGWPPVFIRGPVPCRLVPWTKVCPRYAAIRGCIGYVTADPFDVATVGTGMIGNVISIFRGTADLMEIPADSGNFYLPFHDDFFDHDFPEYYRRLWVSPYVH